MNAKQQERWARTRAKGWWRFVLSTILLAGPAIGFGVFVSQVLLRPEAGLLSAAGVGALVGVLAAPFGGTLAAVLHWRRNERAYLASGQGQERSGPGP